MNRGTATWRESFAWRQRLVRTNLAPPADLARVAKFAGGLAWEFNELLAGIGQPRSSSICRSDGAYVDV
jgi:hypothetical protein